MIKKEDIKVGLVFDYPIFKIDTNERCLIRNFVPKDRTATEKFIIHNISETRENPLYADCYCLNAPKDMTVMISLSGIEEYGTFAYYSELDRINSGTVEQVSHPSHYAWLKDLCGVEPIEICQHFDFSVGNALKYIMRKGKVERNLTEKQQRIQDLEKAIYYLKNEIYLMKNDSNNKDNK